MGRRPRRLPPGWHVGPPTYDPGLHRWSVTARSPQPGRRQPPETITETGEDELAALTYLAIRLQERRTTEATARLRTRGRLAYLEGAEEHSRRTRGRGLTGEELERVIENYPREGQRGPSLLPGATSTTSTRWGVPVRFDKALSCLRHNMLDHRFGAFCLEGLRSGGIRSRRCRDPGTLCRGRSSRSGRGTLCGDQAGALSRSRNTPCGRAPGDQPRQDHDCGDHDGRYHNHGGNLLPRQTLEESGAVV